MSIVMMFSLMPMLAFAEENEEPDPVIAMDISEYDIHLTDDVLFYNGDTVNPVIESDILQEGVEFQATYPSAVEPGDYEVYVEGIEPYYGAVTLSFSIVKTEIDPMDNVSIYRKGTYIINPVVTNPNGSTKFTSKDKTIATVSTSGKITAKKKGLTTIVVKNGNARQEVQVKVLNPKLNVTKVSLYVKKTKQLIITGKVGKARYSSTNPKVARVTSKGKIIAKKIGKCTIKVKTNGITLKCKVTVKKKPPVYVYIMRTGKRYHCDKNCDGLWNARALYRVTIQKAKSKGLTKCHVCYYQ